MPITTIDIINPRIAAPPYAFNSCTELKDTPRRYECLEWQETGIYGTDPGYWCQTGCNENQFMYIAEPGDNLHLQFRATDSVNADPQVPTYGWKNTDPGFFVALEVCDLAGTIVWEGPINEIADQWAVAFDELGSLQNVSANVDRLIELTGLSCWFFRVKVVLGVSTYETADTALFAQSNFWVRPGFTYINLTSNEVLEWSGTAWVVVPVEDEDVWYDAAHGNFYAMETGSWVQLPGPPQPGVASTNFDYLTTIMFRLRRCDEEIIHFRSEDWGLDCEGYNHNELGRRWVMEPLAGAPEVIYVDYIVTSEEINEPQNYEPGTIVLTQSVNQIYTRRGDNQYGGWDQAVVPTGSFFMVMNDSAPIFGSLIGSTLASSLIGWVPFTAFAWRYEFLGLLEDIFPGTAFSNDVVPAWAFQHDFKVRGEALAESFPIVRELSEDRRLLRKTQQTQTRVRSYGVPELVAQRVNAVIAADEFFINERPYAETDALRKNNDDGLHWWLDFKVTDAACEAEAECE